MSVRTCLLVNNCPITGENEHSKLGGGDLSLLALLAGLPKVGWRAHVVVPGVGQLTDIFLEREIPFTVLPFDRMSVGSPLKSLHVLLAWRNLIAKCRPDLIHANTTSVCRHFAWIAASLSIPYVSHVRLTMEPGESLWTFRYFPKPSGFIFVSEALKAELWPEFSQICPKSQWNVVHNAIDLASFQESPLPNRPPFRIGIIANLAPLKRHEDFLYMAREMLNVRQDLEFHIVGDDVLGKGRGELLKSLADELGISPNVKFFGHRSDIPDVIRNLHILVSTSEYESFGRCVIEGMAMGRPVIATRVGGVPEIIEDGVTGRLVQVGDVEALSHAALAMLADQGLMEAIGRQAAIAARSRFSLESHATHISAIYNNLVS